MKKFLAVFVLLVSISSFSQALNGYKYIIVPAKFEFLKETDQYKLNTVTKLYLENFGFETYFDTEQLPTELIDKNCNKLFVDVDENNSMFSTKIKINFKDCRGAILFSSTEGSSRSKEYEVAYNEAFRTALKSIANANYKYQEKKGTATLFDEISEASAFFDSLNTYTVKMTTNGFNVVDDDKQIVFEALKTSTGDLYLAQSKDKNGIFIKKGEKWFFEYYKNEKFQSEEIHIWTEIEVGK
jgi:hypothetical protein